ncbi:MAG: HipA domain-containing protein, partial [Flavitalea sp.]
MSHILDVDPPKADNLPLYQEKTRHLSISGVQLKYSLRLEGNRLALVEKGGQYILKPIPPITLIKEADQAPENEHLTMQIAAQVFGIRTAANALIFFKDGTPGYLTRRFDVKADGSKFLQEDMAQLSGRSRQTAGEHFKYDGSYEEISTLIRLYVAAYPPALENYFRLVLFNYLFANGDAHLKNFSLIQSAMSDYILTPAYDLMSTALHTPLESDTALDLYKDDTDGEYYRRYGYFGQAEFRTLADRIGIPPRRANLIITQLLGKGEAVRNMIGGSYLSDSTKASYTENYAQRVKRLGMTGEMIGAIMNPRYPGVYAVTEAPAKLLFNDGKFIVGYFQSTPQSTQLEAGNRYTFVK